MYARFMLDKLSKGVRIINIDQSWINDTNFERRCWRKRGQINSKRESPVNPRVSLLMAICTSGNLYCSLTQVTTDHRVFCLFLTKLSERLTKEDKNWRDNTIILCDGAKYQTCEESRKHMIALGLKVCVSSPYAFSATPIEYAFGYFKQVEINPDRLKTGKK